MIRWSIEATLFAVGLMLSFTSCSYSSRVERGFLADSIVSKIDISVAPEYYDSVTSRMPLPRMTVLKEDGIVSFTFPDRILDRHGLYFVLDRSDSRTVVSFTHEGMPFARYGSVGQGPGEYVSPWDFDVKDSIVHILDTNSKKILRYTIEGEFLSERSLPFFADAIKLTSSGNVFLNLTPNGKSYPQICMADTSMKELSYSLAYPDHYTGGVSTADTFRGDGKDVIYYRSPMDTVYVFYPDGLLKHALVLDFMGKGITEEQRINYVEARRGRQLDDAMLMANTPIALMCGMWVGIVTVGDEQYTVMFDPTANKCGGRKFSRQSSVYDIIEPYGTDENGNLISLLDGELASRCRDYDALDDSIKSALSSGNRVLLTWRLSKN